MTAIRAYYDITGVTYSTPYITQNTAGNYYGEWDITLSAVLKYDCAAQLPQVMGLAREMGIDSGDLSTADLIAAISSPETTAHIAASAAMWYTGPNADRVPSLLVEEVIDFISSCEAYIGVATEFTAGLRGEFDGDGTLLTVEYAMYDGYSDTMESLAPPSEESMFAAGQEQYWAFLHSAVNTVQGQK